jgi:hypothetical protein
VVVIELKVKRYSNYLGSKVAFIASVPG